MRCCVLDERQAPTNDRHHYLIRRRLQRRQLPNKSELSILTCSCTSAASSCHGTKSKSSPRPVELSTVVTILCTCFSTERRLKRKETCNILVETPPLVKDKGLVAGQVTCIWSLSLISHSGCRHQSSRPSTPPWSVSPVSCHGLQGSLPDKSNAGPAAWGWAAEPVSRAALSPTSVSRQESTALGAKLGQELPLHWSKARSTASAGLGAKLGQGHHIRCIARHRATHALCLNAPRNHQHPQECLAPPRNP